MPDMSSLEIYVTPASHLFLLKVEELENEIQDSKAKTEFFRAKMQELVSMLFLSL